MGKQTSTRQNVAGHSVKRRKIMNIVNIIIFLLSLVLVAGISVDTFEGQTFYHQPRYLRMQLWICIFFLAAFFVELYGAEDKKNFWAKNFFFFLVSIPYQYIIVFFHIYINLKLTYLIGFIPLIRGGYAMIIVVRWFASNKITSLVITYLITLLATVYFASLAFFIFEKGVNPDVHGYGDAIWWAAMDVTTVGSNIEAVTTVGRVLSVLLAALGMMMFPIFTVYIASAIRTHNRRDAEKAVAEATMRPAPLHKLHDDLHTIYGKSDGNPDQPDDGKERGNADKNTANDMTAQNQQRE